MQFYNVLHHCINNFLGFSCDTSGLNHKYGELIPQNWYVSWQGQLTLFLEIYRTWYKNGKKIIMVSQTSRGLDD